MYIRHDQAMKAAVLYWEQNGKVLREKVPYAVVSELIAKVELCGEWTEGRNEFGYWLCRIFATPLGLLVMKEWIPAPGYSWDEVEIWWIEI
ncbi:MAG: hypothetical protein QXG57_05965 [Thermofilaceae archaeon]